LYIILIPTFYNIVNFLRQTNLSEADVTFWIVLPNKTDEDAVIVDSNTLDDKKTRASKETVSLPKTQKNDSNQCLSK
jgi:hypothetical protein